jgi:hypothetical protein
MSVSSGTLGVGFSAPVPGPVSVSVGVVPAALMHSVLAGAGEPNNCEEIKYGINMCCKRKNPTTCQQDVFAASL